MVIVMPGMHLAKFIVAHNFLVTTQPKVIVVLIVPPI